VEWLHSIFERNASMSLKPRPLSPVPEDTVRIAKAAFPKGPDPTLVSGSASWLPDSSQTPERVAGGHRVQTVTKSHERDIGRRRWSELHGPRRPSAARQPLGLHVFCSPASELMCPRIHWQTFGRP